MTDSVPKEGEFTDDVAEVGDDAPDPYEGSGEADGRDDAVRADGSEAPTGGDDDLAALRQDFDALNDRHLRLVAEFNNFRRRTEQERLSAWGRAQADVVGKFLDVLDDLSRVAELDLSNGVDLVERKFVRMLEDSGVELIDPQGERFDPERMEAMMRIPADSEEQDEEVAQVFQKGYALKGTLIRPARVSVYKHE
jgi:molecular chaperone GrpE